MKQQASIETSPGMGNPSLRFGRFLRPLDLQRFVIGLWIVAAWICAGAVSALSVVGTEHEEQSFFTSERGEQRTIATVDAVAVQPLRYDSLVYHVSTD